MVVLIFFICSSFLRDPKNRIVQNYYKYKLKHEALAQLFVSQKKVNKFWIEPINSIMINRTSDNPLEYEISLDTLALFHKRMNAIKCKYITFARNNPSNVVLGFGNFLSGEGSYGLIYVPEGSSIEATKEAVEYFRIEPIENKWYYFVD